MESRTRRGRERAMYRPGKGGWRVLEFLYINRVDCDEVAW